MKQIFKLFTASFLLIALYTGCSKSGTTAPAAVAPIADFSYSGAGNAPATVTFTNTSTNATTYTWDFGDNGNSTLANPSHAYTTAGVYTVKLIATGSGGSNSTTKTINITTPTPTPTSLRLTVLDANANIVSGATVYLYPTYNDWLNNSNQVGTTQTSNSSGQVTFTGLSAQKYYWDVVSGCQNNYANGIYTTTVSLTPNVVNTANAPIAGNGDIKLVSNSSNPYAIYLDGTLAISSAAGYSINYLYYIPTGTHSIRVLQLSGYALYPTDKTYTGTVSCGGTLTVTYPN